MRLFGKSCGETKMAAKLHLRREYSYILRRNTFLRKIKRLIIELLHTESHTKIKLRIDKAASEMSVFG